MARKILGLLIGAGLIVIVIISWWYFSTPPTPNLNNKAAGTGRQICPDAWYTNQMPGPAGEDTPPSQYFVINGERVELKELDVTWVKAHCPVNQPQAVQ